MTKLQEMAAVYTNAAANMRAYKKECTDFVGELLDGFRVYVGGTGEQVALGSIDERPWALDKDTETPVTPFIAMSREDKSMRFKLEVGLGGGVGTKLSVRFEMRREQVVVHAGGAERTFDRSGSIEPLLSWIVELINVGTSKIHGPPEFWQPPGDETTKQKPPSTIT